MIKLIEIIWNWFNRRNIPGYYDEEESMCPPCNSDSCNCFSQDNSITITIHTQEVLRREVRKNIERMKMLEKEDPPYSKIELEAFEAEKKIIILTNFDMPRQP